MWILAFLFLSPRAGLPDLAVMLDYCIGVIFAIINENNPLLCRIEIPKSRLKNNQ